MLHTHGVKTMTDEKPENHAPSPQHSDIVTKIGKKRPRSTLVSRNITVASHRTSVRLEPEMWSGLMEICRREHAKLHAVCTMVSRQKPENTSLTAAIRVFIMAYYRAAATEDGHNRAGHGYGLNAMSNRGMMTPGMKVIPAGAVPQGITKQAAQPQQQTQQKPMQHAPFMIGMMRINNRYS